MTTRGVFCALCFLALSAATIYERLEWLDGLGSYADMQVVQNDN